MEKKKIGFIGCGNMASSIIGGLTCASEKYAIYASDPDTAKLSKLSDDLGFIPCASNEELVRNVEIVVLSVKPQVMQDVLGSIKQVYSQSRPVLISIAAGIRCHQILRWLESGSAPCVRVMPNTPALVKAGASGLFALNTTAEQNKTAEDIMRAVGMTVWLEDEALIDTVTAVSGSGPAYFFYMMEAIYNAAVKNGLDGPVANRLTVQTALGAAKLALSSDVDFKTLRQQVTSPGGTTEAAINKLKAHDFSELVENAVMQAVMRSQELSKDT